MADLPYPLTLNTVDEMRSQSLDIFKDLYYNRIGGALVGDVFTADNDVLELRIAEGSGLFKNDDDELDFAVTAGTISNTPAGNIQATTVQGAINELGAGKMQLEGTPRFECLKLKELSSGAPSSGGGKAPFFSYDTPGWDMTVYIDTASGAHGLAHEV